jgi:hypothetical protein
MAWWRWFLRKIGLMSKPTGDIRVFGLVAGTHIIEDIGMDVPHGMTVTIPGELAIRSKDLWRALSQKCLFQLPAAAPPLALPQQAPGGDLDRLRAESRAIVLEGQVRSLEAANMALQAVVQGFQARDQKLDTILTAIQSGMVFAQQPGVSAQAITKQEVADGTAPMFLPSEIRPKGVDARIDVQSESTESDIATTAEKLRRLRQGGKAEDQ